MPYTIEYLDDVIKHDIPALPGKQKEQIKRAIVERLGENPVAYGKPMRYSFKGHRRLRVGDWRVIYRIEDAIVLIVAIGHRKNIYDE